MADLFLNTAQEYVWPSRVRTDRAGENTQVWQLMEDRTTTGEASWLVLLPIINELSAFGERIWTNGMMDLRNHQLMAVADIAEQEPSFDDLTWYGYDPSAPTTMDDGLSTV